MDTENVDPNKVVNINSPCTVSSTITQTHDGTSRQSYILVQNLLQSLVS